MYSYMIRVSDRWWAHTWLSIPPQRSRLAGQLIGNSSLEGLWTQSGSPDLSHSTSAGHLFQQPAYDQSPPNQLKAVLDVVPAGDLGALCGEHWWWLGWVTTSCNPSSTTAAAGDDYSKTVTKFSLESLRKPFPRKYNYQRHLARRMSRY